MRVLQPCCWYRIVHKTSIGVALFGVSTEAKGCVGVLEFVILTA